MSRISRAETAVGAPPVVDEPIVEPPKAAPAPAPKPKPAAKPIEKESSE